MASEETIASGEIGDLEQLLALAQDGPSPSRINAMQALGKLGDPQAQSVLESLLQDDALEIRRIAARVLYQMLAEDIIEIKQPDTLRHLLRFRAPEEILTSPTAIKLFLETLEELNATNSSLDIEHGHGSIVSGSPMEGYRTLTLRKEGTERKLDHAVQRILAFFEGLQEQSDGWWHIGPMRGLGIVAFRQGDRYGETLHELAIARIAPTRYLVLTTRCHYADWD